MIIVWAISDQHTDWGLFRVGDVIDTKERGIPPEVVMSWLKDGYAVEMEKKKRAKSAKED